MYMYNIHVYKLSSIDYIKASFFFVLNANIFICDIDIYKKKK